MRFLLNLLLISFLPLAATAQSRLPECSAASKHGCIGSVTYTDGNKYVGMLLGGIRHGQGIEYNASGSIAKQGHWANGDLVQSFAIDAQRFPFNSSSVASVRQPPLPVPVRAERDPLAPMAPSQLLPCGSGDKHNCVATYTYPNGNKYVGEWQDNKPNGQGTYTFASGNEYKGEFKDGKANGQGIFINVNSNKYVGAWRDGKRNGQGTFYSLADNKFKGDKFIGEYSDDKRNGYGIYTNSDGAKYTGEYKDDKRNGQGIEYTASGTITKQGRWENGSLVQSFAVDAQRFPFNSSLTASAPQAPVTDPVKAERDRLAADLEASRKKQQELEEQLRVSQAAPAPNIRPTQSVPTERRVALVIGNAAYKISPLKNPVNDSTDIAQSLRAVGFDVIEVNNATLVAMREATRRFADKLVNNDVGLVYYSGHGVEVKGKNYLIPVNADIKREYEVVDQAFDASQFLEMMDSIRGPNNKRVNILLVDACRNNELQRSWRSTSNGLGRMDAPGGTFISFATAPGRVAADGLGRNSPYTKHLLQALKQPNMPIEQVFKVVRRNVMDETKGEQIPWDNSSLVGDFFFTVQR